MSLAAGPPPYPGHARLGVLVAGMLALSACPARPAPPVASTAVQPRTDPACEQAARSRAGVPGLLAEGKLDRTVRVLQQANLACPATAPLTWPQLAETLLELGRADEAAAVAAEMEHGAAATPDALRAAQAVRDRASEVRKRAPDPEGLYSGGVAAKGRGADAEAQRLFDRAAVDLQRAARNEAGRPVELSFDTPNGLASRCVCEYRGPPACLCGATRWGSPQAVLEDINKLGAPEAIAYSPDGRLFAASHGERIYLFDARTWRERSRLLGHTAFVHSLAWSPDGKTLVSGAADRTARSWDVATGEERSRLTDDGAGITALTYAPDGSWLAVGSGQGTFFAWDPASAAEVHEASKERCAVGAVAFSADGRTLAATLCAQGMVLWEAPWFTQQTSLEKRLGLWGTSAAWSPSGRTLAFCNEREGLWLAEPDTGRKRRLAKLSRGLVAFAPDGTSLATSSPNVIYDLATNQTLPYAGHRYGEHAMAYSPDSKTLPTSGHDGAVRVWDTRTGAEVRAIRRHSPRGEGARAEPGRRVAGVGLG